MKKRSIKLSLIVILFFFASGTISAQTNLFKSIPGETSQFSIRFMRPYFAEDADLSILSGIYDLMANVPIDDGWSLDVTLPYINYSFGDAGSESGLGNIYLGAQKLKKMAGQRTSVFSLGFFIPTAAEEIQFMGIVTHFDKFYKYTPDVLTFYGNYSFFKTFESLIRLGLEVGPDIMFPWTSEAGDIDLYFHYGVAAGLIGKYININAELQGLVVVTQEAEELSDRFVHSANIGASYSGRKMTAGIFYKFYLKEGFIENIDGVLGINLSYMLK